MTIEKLPIKLGKEPLVDVTFELRFKSTLPVANILPGIFFNKIQIENKVVEQLPANEIPREIRLIDPNLRYQPLVRIHWEDFLIVIGDNMVGLGCKMPYVGWTMFKPKIIELVSFLIDSKIAQEIERYSLKYVDVIEGKDVAEQIQRTNVSLKIGTHEIDNQTFSFRTEMSNGDLTTIVQLAAPVVGKVAGGQERRGILIETDVLYIKSNSDMSSFSNDLPEKLEKIHNENKRMFFGCLKPETITFLEPTYE